MKDIGYIRWRRKEQVMGIIGYANRNYCSLFLPLWSGRKYQIEIKW